jgi:hypothetical protein
MRPFLTCFLFIFLISNVDSYAQRFHKKRKQRSFFFTGGTGITSYFGELNNPGDLFDSRLNINVGVGYFFNDWIAARSEVTWYQIEGDDAKADDPGRVRRNLSFVSNNLEFNVVGMVHLFPRPSRRGVFQPWNLYGFAGAGFTYINPKAELDGTKHSLPPLMTEGEDYSQFVFVIPAGAGVKYYLTPFLNFSLEGGSRTTFSDYLDDVSTEYVDPNSFEDPIAQALADRRPEIGLEPAQAGDKRGNPDANDWYWMLNVKVVDYLATGYERQVIWQRRKVNHRSKRSIKRRKAIKIPGKRR